MTVPALNPGTMMHPPIKTPKRKFTIGFTAAFTRYYITNPRHIAIRQILWYNIVMSTLYLMPVPKMMIFDQMHFGRNTKKNDNEQGGILLGETFTKDNKTYGIIRDVILSKATGTKDTFHMNIYELTEMCKRARLRKDINGTNSK